MKFNDWHKLAFIIMFFSGALSMYLLSLQTISPTPKKHWEFQSIDTMKYSRDLARDQRNNPEYAIEVEKQVKAIAQTGATHIAIGTPYDDEFVPVIKLWTRTAREYHLKVWFRGNWSGWEKWFDYESIDEKTHIAKTRQFIINNRSIFEDGDVFSSCPECENGANVSLNTPDKVSAYRHFLITEYLTTKVAFQSINKKVASNYYSMNADVAKAVMDHETTAKLDGLVVIDHYVKSPQQLAQDVVYIAQLSGGKVVLGEMGAPIPDINGAMTDDQQRRWLFESMVLLASLDELKGVNYWVNKDGSTALWHKNNKPKPAVIVLTQYFGGIIDPTPAPK